MYLILWVCILIFLILPKTIKNNIKDQLLFREQFETQDDLMGFSKGWSVMETWNKREIEVIIDYVYASTIQGREGHDQSSLVISHPTSKNNLNMKMDTGSG